MISLLNTQSLTNQKFFEINVLKSFSLNSKLHVAATPSKKLPIFLDDKSLHNTQWLRFCSTVYARVGP